MASEFRQCNKFVVRIDLNWAKRMPRPVSTVCATSGLQEGLKTLPGQVKGSLSLGKFQKMPSPSAVQFITLCPAASGTAPDPDSDLGGPQVWKHCAPTENRAFLIGRKNKAGFDYVSSTHMVFLQVCVIEALGGLISTRRRAKQVLHHHHHSKAQFPLQPRERGKHGMWPHSACTHTTQRGTNAHLYPQPG